MTSISYSCWCCAMNLMILLITLSTCIAQNMTHKEMKEYLIRFSHLGEDNPDPLMQELRAHPDQQFALAIRSFQRFAGLNITGIADNNTVHMMQMPRCGVRDVLTMSNVARRRKRYAASPGDKWDKLHLTYRFLGYTPDLPRTTVRSVFQQAFQMWSEVSALSFAETSSVSDIEISFASRSHGDRNPFDGPGNVLAHAYFPGRRIGGDAHFDEDETWTHQTSSGINLLQVAVHELGHSLGLGHSDVQSAIMAPFYGGYKPNFKLDQDDIDGIRYLYGHGGSNGRPTSMGPRPTTTPTSGTPPPPPPPDYCPLASFCRDFDAVDVIYNTVYVFKGQFYATLSRYGTIVDIRRIQDTWSQLPTHLDAVMSTSSYVYFFKGSEYWRMNNRAPGTEGVNLRKKLIRQGFPGAPYNMDAAFVWSGNGRVYFIKGNSYYRYRGGHGVDPEYPRPLSVWRGVRSPVNDVVKFDGMTYFFSGTEYQVFDDDAFRAGSPRPTQDLLECCTRGREQLAEYINDGSSFMIASISQVVFTVILSSITLSALL